MLVPNAAIEPHLGRVLDRYELNVDARASSDGAVRLQSSRNSTDSPEDHEAQDWAESDRRATDRRAAATRLWTHWLTPLRREGGRRDSDQSHYVDRYTKRDVVLVLTIFVLNLGDAYFTMRWLGRGGGEANPIMDFFLDIGPTAFLLQKCIVVGFWLLLLLIHKNFRFARLGLYASLAVYLVLMVVHFAIVLLGVEPPPRDELTKATLEIRAQPDETHSESRIDRAHRMSLAPNRTRSEPVRRADPRAWE